MPKYKLRLPPKGDYLYADGDYWFIGDTAAEAHEFFADEIYEPVEWVHPVVLRGHVLYKADIENGDAYEDAEPGDSTFNIVVERDSEKALSHELRADELLAWVDGPVKPWWTYGPKDWSASPTYTAHVGDDSLGEFDTREDADAAVKRVVAERVEEWKAAHPEFYRPLPEEPDDA